MCREVSVEEYRMQRSTGCRGVQDVEEWVVSVRHRG